MRNFLNKNLKWFVLGLIYLLASIALAWPGQGTLADSVLGGVTDDTFDEMVLTGAVAEQLSQFKFPLYSRALEFPLFLNLVITHKSYSHTLIACFWKTFLPWPLWWNCAVLTAVWLGALGAAWAVSRVCRSEAVIFLSGLTMLFTPFVCRMMSFGRMPQLFTLPVWLALGSMAVIFAVRKTEAGLAAEAGPGSSAGNGGAGGDAAVTPAAPLPGAGNTAAEGTGPAEGSMAQKASAAPAQTPPCAAEHAGCQDLPAAYSVEPAAGYFWLLGLSTLAAASCYWIWAFLLALTGAAALVLSCRRLSRNTLKRLAICVFVVLAAAAPAAWYTQHADPDLQRYASTPAAGSAEHIPDMERAAALSLFPADPGTPRLLIPFSKYLPLLLVLAAAAAFIVWQFKRPSSAGMWLGCAAVPALTGLGPWFSLNGRILAGSDGSPCPAPLACMSQISGLLYYWRNPQTAFPLVLGALLLSWAFAAEADLCRREKLCACSAAETVKSFCHPLSAAVMVLALLCLQITFLGSSNRFVSSSPLRSGLCYPSFQAVRPSWCAELAKMEPGAVLDLPLGYCTNAWQVQFLHGFHCCHTKRPEGWLAANNAFVRSFYNLNTLCAKPYKAAPFPDNGSSELAYGTEVLPRSSFGDTMASRFNHAADPGQNMPPPPGREETRQNEQAADGPGRLQSDASLVINDGLRYIVLHRASCFWLQPEHGDEVFANFSKYLNRRCGPPLYADQYASVYKIPDPSKIIGGKSGPKAEIRPRQGQKDRL